MSRSVINIDFVLKVVTNACEVYLLKIKTGHGDQSLTQLATESRKLSLPSSPIAAFPSIFEVLNSCLELKITETLQNRFKTFAGSNLFR